MKTCGNLQDGVHSFKRLKLFPKWFKLLVTDCRIAQTDLSQQHPRKKMQSSVLVRSLVESKDSSSNIRIDGPSAIQNKPAISPFLSLSLSHSQTDIWKPLTSVLWCANGNAEQIKFWMHYGLKMRFDCNTRLLALQLSLMAATIAKHFHR